MPVFDFSNATTEKKDPECTYTTFRSNETKPSPEKPILVLDRSFVSTAYASFAVPCV